MILKTGTIIALFDEFEKISAADLGRLAYQDPELYEFLKEAGIFSAIGGRIAKGIRQAGGFKNLAPMKAMRRAGRTLTGGLRGGRVTPRGRAAARSMTGTGTAPMQTAFDPRRAQWQKALGSQPLHTELTGVAGTAGEQASKRMARQSFERTLHQQGAVYRGAPGLEQQIGSIGGHPGTLTRTPARVVEPSAVGGTVAGGPAAMRRATATSGTVAGGTVAGGPAARRAASQARRPTVSFGAPGGSYQSLGYAPTVVAPA